MVTITRIIFRRPRGPWGDFGFVCAVTNEHCFLFGQVLVIIGRSERIRTSGPCVPNTVLYQAELHSGVRGYRPVGPGLQGKGGRMFFFEKTNQKTFSLRTARLRPRAQRGIQRRGPSGGGLHPPYEILQRTSLKLQRVEVFASFFKKKRFLSSFRAFQHPPYPGPA